ncbi:hypothetical protein Lepto7375DRAFT_1902 [Leptolyngbya sp. PCC 7375]|nr:hypothetical protein Lepto7375DRAFT_1902 [Leptolyngbya sp. PCC 7375]
MATLNIRGLIFLMAAAVLGHLISYFFFDYVPQTRLAFASIFMVIIDLVYRARQDNLKGFSRWYGSRGGGSAVFMPIWLFGMITFVCVLTGHADV